MGLGRVTIKKKIPKTMTHKIFKTTSSSDMK